MLNFFNNIQIVKSLYPFYETMIERGFKTASIHHDFIEHGIVCHVFGFKELVFEADTMEDIRHNQISESMADIVSLFLKGKEKPKEGQLYGGGVDSDDIEFFWQELQKSKFAQKCKRLYALEEHTIFKLIKKVEFKKKVEFYEELVC